MTQREINLVTNQVRKHKPNKDTNCEATKQTKELIMLYTTK